MNCDEAFDALTDPSESNQSALNWHLEFCPRCREMREVLAPALAMFAAESLAPEAPAPHRLPERSIENPPRHISRPFLTPEAIRVAELSARNLHPARKRGAMRWITVGMIGLLTALGVFFAMNPSESASPRNSDPLLLADKCLWTQRDAHPPAGSADQPSSRWVVLSCVACHLEHSLE